MHKSGPPRAAKTAKAASCAPELGNLQSLGLHNVSRRDGGPVSDHGAKIMKTLKTFFANESGATAIEYALIASLIAVALITILGSIGSRLAGEFSEVSGALK